MTVPTAIYKHAYFGSNIHRVIYTLAKYSLVAMSLNLVWTKLRVNAFGVFLS